MYYKMYYDLKVIGLYEMCLAILVLICLLEQYF